MPWREPVTGGDDELAIDKIQSHGFVSGSAGWRIGRPGDVEINNLTARGSIEVGVTPNPQVIIDSIANVGYILLPTNAASELSSDVNEISAIKSFVLSPGANELIGLIIQGPESQGAGATKDQMRMILLSESASGTSPALFELQRITDAGVTLDIINADDSGIAFGVGVTCSSDLLVAGNSQMVGNIQLDGNLNGWAGFTPTWTGSVTNPTLGNGTVSAAYKNIGDLVYFYIKYVFGTTTTFGSGAYGFSLPLDPLNDQNVSASYIDASASARFPGTAWLTNGSGIFRALTSAGGVGISSTVPFTWANGDTLLMSGSYRSV